MGLFIALGVSVITVILGLVILFRNTSLVHARLFAVLCAFIVTWVLSSYLTDNLSIANLELANITNKLAFLSGFGAIFLSLIFTYYFPVRRKIGRSEAILIFCLGAVGMMSSLVEYVVGEAYVADDALRFSFGPGSGIYIACCAISLVLLYKNLNLKNATHTKKQKKQARIILIAFGSTAILGLLLNLIIPIFSSEWHTAEFGPISILIVVSLVAYAIVRYGLFDIRQATVRTVTYVLSLATLSAAYYVLAYAMSLVLFSSGADSVVPSATPINIGLALVLAFVFQPIKSFFDRVTNSIFYRDRYDSDEFIARLSSALTSTTHLRTLLQRASKEVGETLKSETVLFHVKYDNKHSTSSGFGKYESFSRDVTRVLDEYANVYGRGVVVVQMLPEDSTVYKLLAKQKIALLLPLIRSDDILGYLALGERRSGSYTRRDAKILETISDELVIAVQNTLSVQLVNDANIHLEQRIKDATHDLTESNKRLIKLDEAKDEFISMASHQLRTPLTSVKGYLSMVLDGDTGKLEPDQRKILEQAFNSSQRMVYLIGDFLNVSRIQTGKFEIEYSPVNLANVVSQEINQLVETAKTKRITMTYEVPENFPTISADENKLRQVMMNFMDNAIYYSPADTTIKVQLYKDADSVVFKVTDQGIGVPKSDQPKLFTKFFRAPNAKQQRPDGTGIGLYMAKKVIVGHHGTVIFETKEGKGSTFGFKLPIKK